VEIIFFDPHILKTFISILKKLYKDICKNELEDLKEKLNMFLEYYFTTEKITIRKK